MNSKYLKSIRGKILIAILLITQITSLAVTLIFYRQSARTIEDNYISSLQQRAEQLMTELDGAVERMYHINVYASSDSRMKENIRLYLEDEREEYLEQLAELLYGYKVRSDTISSMCLLIPESGVIVTSEEYPMYRKGITEEQIKKVTQTIESNPGPILIDDLIYEGETLFSCADTVKDEDGQIMGYLFSNTTERKLYYDYLAGWDDKAMKDAVILDLNHNVVVDSDSDFIGDPYSKYAEYKKWIDGKETAGSDGSNIYVYCSATFAEVGLLSVLDKKIVLGDLMRIRWFFFGILTVFMAVAGLLAFYLSYVIYHPLRKLMFTMEEVSTGNLHTRAQVVSGDEIGELAQEFNEMLDQIENLIEKLIEEENKKKDMELEALQYQITPHFMYNTLNSIKFAALLKGDKEIGQVIGDFVELLQAAISKKGTFLTVAEELHILQNYIRLQEFRYGGSFEVIYEVSDEARECMVPRLILQPLVENALLHGMDMKERKGRLKIGAFITEGKLYLKVVDNGRGMSEEQIKSLLNSKVKKEKGFTAIGIPNIRDRLKLYYGEQGGITYDSSTEGTTAIIYLPAQRGEE